MKFSDTRIRQALWVVLCAAAGCSVDGASDELSTTEAGLDGGGNFSHSCSNIRLEPGSIWLHASCASAAGASVDTRIDLNNHLGNNNGGLTWWSGGAYATCAFGNVFAFRGDMGLDAQCRDVGGALHFTSVNLDQCIANRNGTLVYIC